MPRGARLRWTPHVSPSGTRAGRRYSYPCNCTCTTVHTPHSERRAQMQWGECVQCVSPALVRGRALGARSGVRPAAIVTVLAVGAMDVRYGCVATAQHKRRPEAGGGGDRDHEQHLWKVVERCEVHGKKRGKCVRGAWEVHGTALMAGDRTSSTRRVLYGEICDARQMLSLALSAQKSAPASPPTTPSAARSGIS